MIGALHFVASLKLPALNSPRGPPLLRVPSGKITREWPYLMILIPSTIAIAAPFKEERSIKTQWIRRIQVRTIGSLSISTLDT